MVSTKAWIGRSDPVEANATGTLTKITQATNNKE